MDFGRRNMEVGMLFIFLVLISVVTCTITNKEYARLPPVFELDNYDRCMLMGDQALFCSIEFMLKPIDVDNVTSTWRHIKELNESVWNYRHDKLRHGICVPLACPNITTPYTDPEFKSELARCYSKKYQHLGIRGDVAKMHCNTNEQLPFDFYDKTVAVTLILYVGFILYASLHEGIKRYGTTEEYKNFIKSSYGKFIACFSMTRNWFRLSSVNESEVETFRAIQGIRFYNMVIVVFCHAAMGLCIASVGNTIFIEQWRNDLATVLLSSGPYVVETFFLISSLLLTYNIFVTFNETTGKKFTLKTVGWILIYRYIRLTPALAVVVILHSTLLAHAGEGPLWETWIVAERNRCRENYWTNLLYLNNQINASRMCIPETWYLAADMHAFILTLVILYFTVKKPKRLLWVLPMTWLAVQTVFLKRLYDKKIYSYHIPYPESVYELNGMFKKDGVWINTIGSTAPNLVGTIMGIVSGYVFFKYKDVKFSLNKVQTTIWWFLTFGVGLSLFIFPGLWFFSRDYYDSFWFSLPLWGSTTTIFGFCLLIMFVGFANGVGWAAKWVCEWRPAFYLARISYSTYLTHVVFITWKIGSSKQLSYVTTQLVLTETLQVLSCGIILGLILTVLVELPVSAIQSTYLKLKTEDPREDKDVANKED